MDEKKRKKNTMPLYSLDRFTLDDVSNRQIHQDKELLYTIQYTEVVTPMLRMKEKNMGGYTVKGLKGETLKIEIHMKNETTSIENLKTTHTNTHLKNETTSIENSKTNPNRTIKHFFKRNSLAQNSDIETVRRAAVRSASEAEQATALLETARAETKITAERADEAVAATARATRDGARALEDTRRMYQERLEACKLDNDARVKAAEDRARQTEHERQRTETARQAANKELARLQVCAWRERRRKE